MGSRFPDIAAGREGLDGSLVKRWATKLQHAAPMRVVFDVGANCGEVLETMRSCGYRLFGFADIHTNANGWMWADAMFMGDS